MYQLKYIDDLLKTKARNDKDIEEVEKFLQLFSKLMTKGIKKFKIDILELKLVGIENTVILKE